MSAKKRKPARDESLVAVTALSPGDLVETVDGRRFKYIDIIARDPAFVAERSDGTYATDYTWLTGEVRLVRSPNSERRARPIVETDEVDPLLARS